MESSNVYTVSLRNKRNELHDELRKGTSAVLLQSGLDEKWWSDFHGRLLLSAKRPRSPGRRENSV